MGFLSQCDLCTQTNATGTGCAAFPEGIPYEVAMSDVDHRFPVDGDHGVQFVPTTPLAKEEQARMFDT